MTKQSEVDRLAGVLGMRLINMLDLCVIAMLI